MKKTYITILSLILFAALGFAAAFAYFYKEYNADFDFSFNSPNQTVVMSLDTGSLSLKSPGDSATFTVKTQNASDVPLDVSLVFDVITDDGLSKALLVYVDGEYINTLYNLSSGSPFFSTLILSGDGQSDTRKVKLEYHIGGRADRSCSFDITASSSAYDVTNLMPVYSASDFVYAARDLNAGRKSGGLMMLGGDIKLNADINIGAPFTLDLNGHKLDLNGRKITYTGEGKFNLKNSGAPVAATQGKIEIAGGYITFDGTDGWAEKVTLSNYDKTAAAVAVQQKIASVVNNSVFVAGGSYADVMGGYYIYAGGLDFVFYNQATRYENGIYYPAPSDTTYTEVMTVKVNSYIEYPYSYTVYGSGTSGIVDEIEDAYLSYLKKTGDDNPVIPYGIYLPTKFNEYGVSAVWHSSDSDIITSDGVLGDVMSPTSVTLTAVYKVNGRNIIRDYQITVNKEQDNQAKSSYFLSKMPALLYTYKDQFYKLPTKTNYKLSRENGGFGIIDLGITDIEYALESSYSFLTLSAGDSLTTLTLNTLTEKTSAELTITLTFGTEEETLSYPINIDAQPIITYDKVYDYLTEEMIKRIDGGNLINILSVQPETSGFTLPVYYKENTEEENVNAVITYSVSDESGILILSGTHNEIFTIDKTKLKAEDVNITVTATADITNGTGKYSKALLFYVPAAIVSPDVSSAEEYIGFSSGGSAPEAAFNAIRTAVYKLTATDGSFTIIDGAEGQKYILTRHLAKLKNLNLSAVHLEDASGLKFCTALTSLIISGTPQSLNFSDGAEATLKAIAQLDSLTSLEAAYCNINDLSVIETLVGLKRLNAAGNALINFTDFIYLDGLEYLDLSGNSGGGLNAVSVAKLNEWQIAYAYYFTLNGTQKQSPQLYYTASDGNRTLYEGNLSDNQKKAVQLAGRMKDLRVTHGFSQLATAFADDTAAVSWSVSDSFINSSGYIRVVSGTSGGSKYCYLEKTVTPEGSVTVVLSLTVTVGGESFTRNYILEFIGDSI